MIALLLLIQLSVDAYRTIPLAALATTPWTLPALMGVASVDSRGEGIGSVEPPFGAEHRMKMRFDDTENPQRIIEPKPQFERVLGLMRLHARNHTETAIEVPDQTLMVGFVKGIGRERQLTSLGKASVVHEPDGQGERRQSVQPFIRGQRLTLRAVEQFSIRHQDWRATSAHLEPTRFASRWVTPYLRSQVVEDLSLPSQIGLLCDRVRLLVQRETGTLRNYETAITQQTPQQHLFLVRRQRGWVDRKASAAHLTNGNKTLARPPAIASPADTGSLGHNEGTAHTARDGDARVEAQGQIVIDGVTFHLIPLVALATTPWPHVCVVGPVVFVRRQADGDVHVTLDDGKTKVVLEIVPQIPLPRPRRGTIIRACGVSRYDRYHRWGEVHPVLGWRLIK